MARVTVVKKAQQRYRTVPVIDPETGEQKKVPVMKNGVQKTTKKGKPVFMRLTEEDRTQPLDPYRCDYSGCDIGPEPGKILPGQSYKWIKPKSGPYGGSRKNRHIEHPSWQVWEYSSSMSARLAQISHDFWAELDGVDNVDDVQSALDNAAEQIKELASEKEEAASNIEDGFGHATEKSEELSQIAQDLESWADEISALDIPDLPEPEEEECPTCGGTGKMEETAQADEDTDPDEDCTDCDGTGQVELEEPSDEQMDSWREELQDALSQIDEPPV